MVDKVLYRNECVFLLHGIAKTSRFMLKIARYLFHRGYTVVNVDYPSRKFPIQELAEHFLGKAVSEHCQENISKIHFVSHSMGGLLVRFYLNKHEIANLGRVVMLSPPNQGSELADLLVKHFFYTYWFGPAGKQLTTQANDFLSMLGSVHFELGIIMGNKTYNPFSSWIFGEENDGRVSVSRSKIQGMKDHIVLPCTHNGIASDVRVLEQIVHFLANGVFQH